MGLPGCHSGKESTCQYRRFKRSGLDPCSRKGQHTPVFLPGEFHGQRSPAGDTKSERLTRLSEHTKRCSLPSFLFLPSTALFHMPLLQPSWFTLSPNTHAHHCTIIHGISSETSRHPRLCLSKSQLRCSLNASSSKSPLKLLLEIISKHIGHLHFATLLLFFVWRLNHSNKATTKEKISKWNLQSV